MIAWNEPVLDPTSPTRPRSPAAEDHRKALLQPVESHDLQGGRADGTAIARAVGAEDLLLAHRYLHDALVEHGFMEPAPRGLRIRRYEAVPEMAAFLAKAGRDVLAVQCAIVDHQDIGLPSDGPFYIEIDALRQDGRHICEVVPPAVSAVFQKSLIFRELMRCCVSYAVSMGCDELIAPAEPSKASQYVQMGFRRLSPVRVFSSEMPFPAVLMGMELDALAAWPADGSTDGELSETVPLQEYYLENNPYQRYMTQWAVLADKAFGDPEFLRELFVWKTDFLSQCTSEELAAIRTRWGSKVFDEVHAATETLEARNRLPAETRVPEMATTINFTQLTQVARTPGGSYTPVRGKLRTAI